MSERKFFRTTFTVTVLTEGPNYDWSLGRILKEGDNGRAVVDTTEYNSTEIDGPTMARYLTAARSDPATLGLTEDGKEIDEETDEEDY